MSNDSSVALVTGASSGIGEATVRRLVRRGYKVAAVARRADRLEALAAESDGAVLALSADVTDAEQARSAVGRTVSEFGSLEVLVNNAGIMLLGPFETSPPGDWRQMFDLNVLALMTLSQEAIPHLRKAAAGARGIADIINVGSVAGRVARPNFAAYNASKWAVTAFTEALRQELAPDGVRVSVVQPGAVETELLGHVDPGFRERLAAGPLGSVQRITADDVARTIEYLATLEPAVAVNELVVRFSRQPF
ncbi:MAG TPA: SDR family oxidoreductase [Jatrophihabitantaceae bacterium]|nr:SDR family oxidoreductase [Jatrophihabitantaceae bacterium]